MSGEEFQKLVAPILLKHITESGRLVEFGRVDLGSCAASQGWVRVSFDVPTTKQLRKDVCKLFGEVLCP